MTNPDTTSPSRSDWTVMACLYSGEAYDYANGFGYILFRTEHQSIVVRHDGPQRVTPAPNWRGLIRERGLLDELTAGESGFFLDAGPVRLSGELQDWQRLLERLVRPPRAAILESPGWRARAIEAHLPVASVEITRAES